MSDTQTLPKDKIKTIVSRIILRENSTDTNNNFRHIIYEHKTHQMLKEIPELLKIFFSHKTGENWYQENMLDKDKLDADQVLRNSFMAKKEMGNLLKGLEGEERKKAWTEQVVRKAEETIQGIESFETNIDFTLDVVVNGESKKFTKTEILIFLRNLFGRQHAVVGGVSSSSGFQVEKYLMVIICKILKIPEEAWEDQADLKARANPTRQIDFFIEPPGSNHIHQIEVTLTGSGNPESQDKQERGLDLLVVGATTTNTVKLQKELGNLLIVLEDGDVIKQFVLYFQNIGFTPVVPANKKELEDKLQKSLKEVEL